MPRIPCLYNAKVLGSFLLSFWGWRKPLSGHRSSLHWICSTTGKSRLLVGTKLRVSSWWASCRAAFLLMHEWADSELTQNCTFNRRNLIKRIKAKLDLTAEWEFCRRLSLSDSAVHDRSLWDTEQALLPQVSSPQPRKRKKVDLAWFLLAAHSRWFPVKLQKHITVWLPFGCWFWWGIKIFKESPYILEIG